MFNVQKLEKTLQTRLTQDQINKINTLPIDMSGFIKEFSYKILAIILQSIFIISIIYNISPMIILFTILQWIMVIFLFFIGYKLFFFEITIYEIRTQNVLIPSSFLNNIASDIMSTCLIMCNFFVGNFILASFIIILVICEKYYITSPKYRKFVLKSINNIKI